jgi:hypothetical protein
VLASQLISSDVKVVRVARSGGGDAAKVTRTDEFELKRQVRDLFEEELERLHDGTVIRLQFRNGLPFLLETTPSVV